MMRTRLFGKLAAAGIGLGAAALFAAGPAAAQPMPGGPYFTLSPSTVAPGGTVSISTGCEVEAPAVDVSAPTIGTVTLQADAVGPASHNYSGSVTIAASTPHGTYEFTGPCGSASLVVGPGGVGPRGGTGLDDADNGALVALGAGTLAAAAAGGLWLLRRRSTGSSAGNSAGNPVA
jgi:hypothetical protein